MEEKALYSSCKIYFMQTMQLIKMSLKSSIWGEGDGFGWGGVEGWGENADNCN